MVRVRSRSEAHRYGEGTTHIAAVSILVKFWRKYSSHTCSFNWKIDFTDQFIRKHKLKYDSHEYDFVTYLDMPLTYLGFIEVDGEIHKSDKKKINDGVAEDFIRQNYPNAFFIRLKKDEILGSEYLDYLKEKLKDVI